MSQLDVTTRSGCLLAFEFRVDPTDCWKSVNGSINGIYDAIYE